MTRERIQAEVDQLKTEVEQAVLLSDQQKEELTTLTQQLELMMSGETDHPEQDLIDTLEQQVLLYEETHPLVARVIDNVLNLLHSIGI